MSLSLSLPATSTGKFNVKHVDNIYHMSLNKSVRVWASDNEGNLVQTDLQGNQLQKIQTSPGFGYHTVTQDGDLIFIDKDKKVINKIARDNNITAEFINTGDWKPLSIHCSHINGDILAGMMKDRMAKVTRCNKTGKELQNIQWDNIGRELYREPRYITENINGDVCVSDFDKKAVLVVNRSGQHRFSYTGQGSAFCPYEICTDVLGHILVCDFDAVYLLDKDGQFLSLLLAEQHGVRDLLSVCADDGDIYVGGYENNTVKVYKYLQ